MTQDIHCFIKATYTRNVSVYIKIGRDADDFIREAKFNVVRAVYYNDFKTVYVNLKEIIKYGI